MEDIPMAINSNAPVPSVNKIHLIQYINPDGTFGFSFEHADNRSADDQGNLEMFKLTPVVTLACGHVWPPTMPFAACEKCRNERLANPFVCREDFHRCVDCMSGVCPQHSHASPDESEKGRLCEACFLIRKHGWLLHTVQRWLKSHL
jgi:hypothetical protein